MKLALSPSLLELTAIVPLANAQYTAHSNANCTVFDWDGKPGYLQNGTEERVSGAATCKSASNATHACPIVAEGQAQVSFDYNTSITNVYWNTPHGTENYLHSIVLRAVNSSLDGTAWPQAAVGSIDTTQALEPGTSGYINFMPYLRCFVGTMSNCTGGIEDGVVLEACAPVIQTVDGSGAILAILEGVFSIERVPEEDVDQYSDPFANKLSGLEGGAGRLSVLRHAIIAVLATTLALVAASI